MTKEKIITIIQNILATDFDRNDIIITEKTVLEDLYLSSLELADLILLIEEALNITTPFGNGEFPFAYLYDFIDYLYDQVNSKDSE